jgi:hypothetical protein
MPTATTSHPPYERRRLVLVLLLCAILISCSSEGDALGATDNSVRPIASAEGVPFTQTHDVLLLPDGRACLFVSFDLQVVCGGDGWKNVTRHGRSGRAPGEFGRGAADLIRWSGGYAVLNDSRLSFFTNDGQLARTINISPGNFAAAFPADSIIVGVTWEMPRIDVARVTIMSAQDGAILFQRLLSPQSEPSTPGPSGAPAYLAVSETGTLAVSFNGNRVELLDEAGELSSFFDYPEPPEHHSERDLEEWAEGYRIMSGSAPTRKQLEERIGHCESTSYQAECGMAPRASSGSRLLGIATTTPTSIFFSATTGWGMSV